MHCHHEKLVIVDGEVAFVGGIDLTVAGRRPLRRARAPDARRPRLARRRRRACAGRPSPTSPRTSRARWHEVDRRARSPPVAPPSRPPATSTVQVVRTVPEKRLRLRCRAGDFRILEAYTRALRGARSSIYLENQFLWSPEIVEILAEKLRDPPTDDFRVVVLLPAKPNNGADDTRGQLGVLVDADDGAGRFLAATIVRARPARVTGPLYVHAKVGHRRRPLADDRLGEPQRALALQRHRDERRHLRPGARPETRLRLWAEHLEASPEDVAGPRRGRRRAVAPDRRRAAPPARRGAPGDAPPARAARRLAALRCAARPAREPRRRRLT